jgi:hypothetical protein
MQYARERTQDGKALVDFAMDVFEGKPLPMVIRKPLPDGTVVETKFDATPTLDQRIEAMNFLAERGFVRPTQRLEGEVRTPIMIVHRMPPHDPLAQRGTGAGRTSGAGPRVAKLPAGQSLVPQ